MPKFWAEVYNDESRLLALELAFASPYNPYHSAGLSRLHTVGLARICSEHGREDYRCP